MASVQELLERNSTEKYYIEYDEYLANHLADAIIAQSRLGASQEDLEKFIRHYIGRLENPDDYAADNKLYASTPAEELKGKRLAYYVILNHYLEEAKACESVEELIRKVFPDLCLGLTGSAFHGLIHTGYGYVSGNRRVVCDGLAYLHHSYLPLIVSDSSSLAEPLGKAGRMDILEVLHQFRQDRELIDTMTEKSTTLDDEVLHNLGDGFGPKTGALLAFRGDKLLEYAKMIRLPKFFDSDKSVLSQLDPLLKWIIDTAITLYVISGTRNDFFLLHGVTSSWALHNFLPVIQDEAVVNQTLHVFLCGLLATYMCQGCPVLDPKLLPSGELGMFSWEKIIEETMSKHDRDEHIYKLVQVCHDMAEVNTDPQIAAIYKEATQVALMYPFVF